MKTTITFFSTMFFLCFSTLLLAQPSEGCEDLQGDSWHGWQATLSTLQVVPPANAGGNRYIEITDVQSDPQNGQFNSYISNQNLSGDLSCLTLCFDFQVDSDGDIGVIPLNPQIQLFTFFNGVATFQGPTLFETDNFWTTVCVDVDPTDSGDWNVSGNWETIISNVQQVRIITEAAAGTEVVWMDNICVNELELATIDFHFEHENGQQDDLFCFGEDIFFDARPTEGDYYQYQLHVMCPDQNDSYYIPWNENTPINSTINLTEAATIFGDPTNDTDVFLPGSTYKIKLIVSTECNDWVQHTEEFTVECCKEFQANPFFLLDASSANQANGTFTLKAKEYELYDNLEAEHEWYYFTSVDAEAGPFIPVAIVEGPDFVYSPAQFVFNHHVIHKITTPCGVYCKEQIMYHTKKDDLESPEPNDCKLIEEIFDHCGNLPIPTNLTVFENLLTWSPVIGATSYIVTITTGESACCEEGTKPKSYQFYVTSAELSIPKSLRSQCFEWSVMAKCPKGISAPAYSCHEGNKGLKEGMTIDDRSNSLSEIQEIMVYPNPVKNLLSFEIEEGEMVSQGFTLNLFNATGHIVYSNAYQSGILGGTIEVSDLAAGYYLMSFESKSGERYFKKVVITE